MRQTQTLILASTNRHKFEEMSILFKSASELILTPANEFIRNTEKLGLVETSDHYYDNAFAKARACNHACHYPSLADDSGLEVDALSGAPGVKSHRYALARAGETQDEANIKKLLESLKNVPAEKRTARFICHLVLVMEGTHLHTVGTLEGSIAMEPRGRDGFGYDPIFIPKGETKTLAELGPDLKNRISHRAHAVQALLEQLKTREWIISKP